MAKILLVEDDIPLQRLYESALDADYEVIAVGSSAEALDAIQTYRPELIILDMNLPDAPGSRIIEYIESHSELAQIQVVVMTGFSRYQNDNMPGFVVHVLSKPVTTSMLLRTVNAILNQSYH